MSKVRDRILVITDVMLGALYADATMTGEEDRAVRELLAKLLLCTPETLPAHVDQRIREFSLLRFDIELAAKDFLADPPMKKRRLLELVAALADKDGTDMREDEYIRDLAQCLGMQPDEYQGIVLDYEIGALRQSFEALRITEEITGVQETHDPEADLPRWRRTALKQRRESQQKLEATASAAATPTQGTVGRKEPPARPKTLPPPIPEAAKKKA